MTHERVDLTISSPSIPHTPPPNPHGAQEDLFHETLTVQEILEFNALLRLPGSMTRAEKFERVEKVMKTLGIDHARDTRVGSMSGGGGISGGERKRLSIAVELLTGPKLLVCDEPTSGLDSATALSVMNTLYLLAQRGHTVICTIHRPSVCVGEGNGLLPCLVW